MAAVVGKSSLLTHERKDDHPASELGHSKVKRIVELDDVGVKRCLVSTRLSQSNVSVCKGF